MRRYSPARNAIERIRADLLDDAPVSVELRPLEGPERGRNRHPLPVYPLEDPRSVPPHPLPLLPAGLLNRDAPPVVGGGPSYEARQRTQLDDLPRGGEQSPVQVWPAWESRMPAMRDFLLVSNVEPASPGTTLYQVRVPIGWTAFWKRFRYQLDPVPAAISAVQVLVTLLVDGNIVPDFFSLPLGPGMADFQDTFVIAAEGRALQLSVRTTVALPVGTTGIAWFYGNLKPRSGQDEAREVGVQPPAPRPIVIEQAPRLPPAAAPPLTCPPGHKLQRVTVNGVEEMRCVKLLGQSRRS